MQLCQEKMALVGLNVASWLAAPKEEKRALQDPGRLKVKYEHQGIRVVAVGPQLVAYDAAHGGCPGSEHSVSADGVGQVGIYTEVLFEVRGIRGMVAPFCTYSLERCI
jgi:hypothetical protein